MIPKIIKLIASILLLGYGVYQITETFIGNGIFLIILSILFLTACSANKKPIKEHRFFVSAIKQVISPGLGWGK